MAYGLTQSMRLTKASSQYATAPDSASLSPTGNITIEFWIKMKETLSSGQNRNLIIKSTLGASNRSFEVLYQNVGGSKQLFFYIFTGGTPTNFFEGKIAKDLTIDSWFHVAVICTVANAASTKLEWVFDGTSAGNGTGTNTGSGCTAIYDSTVSFRIGQADPVTTGYYVDAQFSLVRLWDVARTASQISTNMCSVLGSTTNLKGEWTLDNTYADNSGNSNTLSGVNTPTFVTDTPSTCASVVTYHRGMFTLVEKA